MVNLAFTQIPSNCCGKNLSRCGQDRMDVISSTQKEMMNSLFLVCNVTVPRSESGHPLHFRRTYPAALARTRKPAVAYQVLDEIPLSDIFAWNNLIHTHLRGKDPDGALAIYQRMMIKGVRLDRCTVPRVLTASRLCGDLCVGRQVHGQAVKLGFLSDLYVVNSLIEMYGHLDGVDAAKSVFDKSSRRNSVSWTLLAKVFTMANKPELAIDVFDQMVELSAEMDSVALATAIGACGMLTSLKQGRRVHGVAKERGLDHDILVSNSLLKMYVDCDSIEDARATFDCMSIKDVISWTEVIHGYVKKGSFGEALKLFRHMNADGIKPDSLSIASVLPACARTAARKYGKEIHGYLLRNGLDIHVFVQNAIMDMYVKSGSLEAALGIFERMTIRDVVSWTVMILGYSLHGHGPSGLELFRWMEKEQRAEIDLLTYEAVLRCCASACMVEEGKFYFTSIKEPNATHFSSMVTLLARSALFDEAKAFIKEHHLARHGEVLRALLDGCRIHNQATLGKQVIEQLCDLEPLNAENYVLLSNWYASYGRWNVVSEVRQTIIDMGLKPKRAYSWMEFRNKVHVFGTGDLSHPRSERIYSELQFLTKKIEAETKIPASDFRFHDVDEERECLQIGHSEMLAVSFGLISTQAGTTINITKNLRVCRSCHHSVKLISKIVEREILIRDPTCFHHFKDGICSCRDFW